MNLCVNARDAMPEGGKLTIEARNIILDGLFAAMVQDAKAGPYVCVRVTDTGMGIAPENLDRVFEPFFTTKGPGNGTGLGLATVLGILRGHQGFVRMDSRVGHGTTLELFFPAAREAVTAPMTRREAALPRGRGELVLVVDDEAASRESLRRLLEAYGYQVIVAADGAAGLAAFSQSRDKVQVVLTDMMMPLMNGPAMIHALRSLDPRLSILGMSGLLELQGGKGLEQVELSAVLAKPFTAGELLRVLRATLGASGTTPSSKGAE
jgi:CheY-like chemotaxis protein